MTDEIKTIIDNYIGKTITLDDAVKAIAEVVVKHNASIGGKTTLERHGAEHYRMLSKKGVEARWGVKAKKV